MLHREVSKVVRRESEEGEARDDGYPCARPLISEGGSFG
jgi:hypothetical protein